MAEAEAAVAAAADAIEENEANEAKLQSRVVDLGKQLDDVLAADKLDHDRAEQLEDQKRVAERELEHSRARRRGLVRKLEETEPALETAKAVVEAEGRAERIRQWNAGVQKVDRWIIETMKLAEELPEGWGAASVTAMNNEARLLVGRLADQGVAAEIPAARWLKFPGDTWVRGANVPGADVVPAIVRQLLDR